MRGPETPFLQLKDIKSYEEGKLIQIDRFLLWDSWKCTFCFRWRAELDSCSLSHMNDVAWLEFVDLSWLGQIFCFHFTCEFHCTRDLWVKRTTITLTLEDNGKFVRGVCDGVRVALVHHIYTARHWVFFVSVAVNFGERKAWHHDPGLDGF